MGVRNKVMPLLLLLSSAQHGSRHGLIVLVMWPHAVLAGSFQGCASHCPTCSKVCDQD